jgi:hypothetical protein
LAAIKPKGLIYGEDEEYVWLTFRNIFVIDDHGYALFYPLPLS